MAPKFNIDKLQENLQTVIFGKTILFSETVGSTNAWAKKLAKLGASEGTVVVAQAQTHGYGRMKREWISPNGGLWLSVIVRPKVSPKLATKLTFMASLALAEVFKDLYDLKAETKWPNDVMVNRRKACGILSEMSTSGEKVNFVVLGIGVNANFNVEKSMPKSVGTEATSLQDQLGRKVRIDELFRAVLEKLDSLYCLFVKGGSDAILMRWKEYACFLGHEVEVADRNERIRGVAFNVDKEGALVLRLPNGTTRNFVTGDLSLRIKRLT